MFEYNSKCSVNATDRHTNMDIYNRMGMHNHNNKLKYSHEQQLAGSKQDVHTAPSE